MAEELVIKIEGGKIAPYDDFQRDELHKLEGRILVCSVATERKARTSAQNRALHKWFKMIACLLNERGEYAEVLLRGNIAWTPSMVKEKLYRPVQKKAINKSSTSDATTAEQSEVVSALQDAFAQKKKFNLPKFPTWR